VSRILAMAMVLSAGLACASNPTAHERGADLDYDGLVEALRLGGTQVTPEAPVDQPFFSVPGRVIVVAGGSVQVFEYGGAPAAQTEARRVSPDGSTIGTTFVTWMAPPHFYHRGRLIVLYVGDEADVKSALTGVLGPQFAGR